MSHRITLDSKAWRSLFGIAGRQPRLSGWTPFHHPQLIAAVAASHALEPLALGELEANQLRAGLVVLKPSHGTAWPISACPYNGPMIAPSASSYPFKRDTHTGRLLLSLMHSLIATEPWAHVRIPAGIFDPRPLLASGFRITPSFTYHIELASPQMLAQRIAPDRRRQIRKAERAGVTLCEIALDSASVAREWGPITHSLHADQAARHRLPPDTDTAGFTTLLAHAAGHDWLRLFVARTATGQPCAFQLTTVQGTRAANLLTGALGDAPTGANALLRLQSFIMLAHEGVQQLDLNGARSGPGGRFKASLGGHLVERWDIAPPQDPTLAQRLEARLRRAWRGLRRR